MLLRADAADAVLCIGQASHAWVSGQLARAWAGLGPRREEICLAALQHDVAWLGWDAAPELDPDSGLPYSFTTIPLPRWIELWEPAPEQLATQSAYAALLLSLHGSRLRAGQQGAESYVAAQRRVQERLLAASGADRDEALADRDLIALWDGLSLAMCLRWAPFERSGLRLGAVGDDEFALEPWPLVVDELAVTCEGRLLRGRFDDEAGMRAALAAAPAQTLRFVVRRP